jgi:hypothetical protein
MNKSCAMKTNACAASWRKYVKTDLKEMRDQNVTIVDLLHDPRFADEPPTNGTRPAEKIKMKQP